MERPEAVEKQTDKAFSARKLAEEKLGKTATGALDFVPIVGDVMAAGDVADSIREGDALGTAVNTAALGVGLVPIVGDLAAKGLKAGLKAYRSTSKVDNKVIDKAMDDVVDSDVVAASTPRAGGDAFVKRQSQIDKDLDDGKIDVGEWDIKSKDNAVTFKTDTGIDVTDKYPEIKNSALRYYKEIEEGVPAPQARKKHMDTIDKVNPIREWEDVPLPTSSKQQVLSLKDNQRREGTFLDITKQEAKKLGDKLGHPLKTAKLKKGDIIKGRLDIPAYSKFNSWVTTVLTKSIKGKSYGDAIHYVSPPQGKVNFIVSEPTAKKIVTGELDKTPFALVEGAYNPMNAKQIRSKVKKLLKDPEWTQLGFDPRRLTGFYTRNNRDKFPVGSIAKEADEVYQIGPLLLAKNVKLDEVPRLNEGGAIRTYKEGGVVPMGQQMEMAFMNEGGVLADDGVNRDPVSGNEVPSGSMAEEVRDDVPAMLSEGEYVVPADVVRYHGIDKFEQLRDEAKMGLQRMEQDGRIGGQPVEGQEEFPFAVEELEGFNEGGPVGDIYEDVMGSQYRPNERYPSNSRFPGRGFELRNFTNPRTGRTVVIPFFNGQPMQYIPPDFLEGGSASTGGGVSDPAASERDRQERENEQARGMTPEESNRLSIVKDAVSKASAPQQTTKSISDMSPLELKKMQDQRDSIGGRLLANVPVVGWLLNFQEGRVKEQAFNLLKTGMNPDTNTPLNAAEVSALRAITEAPERKGIIDVVGDWLTGQKHFDPNPRMGYESGQDFRQMYPHLLTDDATTADPTLGMEKGFDMSTFEPESPDYGLPRSQTEQAMFPRELGEQDVEIDDTGTVAEKAKKTIENEPKKSGMDIQRERNKKFFDGIKNKVLGYLGNQPGVKVLGGKSVNPDYLLGTPSFGQTTSNSQLLRGYSPEDIATINQFHMSEASVPFDQLDNSPTLAKYKNKDGYFTVYEDTEGHLTAGPGIKIVADSTVSPNRKDGSELPTVNNMSPAEVAAYKNQLYDGKGLQNALLKVFDEKKNIVERRYGQDLAQFPPAVQAVVKRTLIDMNMQLIGGTTGFTMMNKALKEGNLAEMAKQITGNYENAAGEPVFSTDPGAKKVGNTKYFNQMSGSKGDVLKEGNRAYNHEVNIAGVSNRETWDKLAKQQRQDATPLGVPDFVTQGGGTSAPDAGVSQPQGFQNIIEPQPQPQYYGPEGFQNVIQPQPQLQSSFPTLKERGAVGQDSPLSNYTLYPPAPQTNPADPYAPIESSSSGQMASFLKDVNQGQQPQQQFPTQLGEQATGFSPYPVRGGQILTPEYLDNLQDRDMGGFGSDSRMYDINRNKIQTSVPLPPPTPTGAPVYSSLNVNPSYLQPSIQSPGANQVEPSLGGTGASGTMPTIPTAPQPRGFQNIIPTSQFQNVIAPQATPASVPQIYDAEKARRDATGMDDASVLGDVDAQMKKARDEQLSKTQPETQSTYEKNVARAEEAQKSKNDRRRDRATQAGLNVASSGLTGREYLEAKNDAEMVAFTGFDSKGNLVDEDIAFETGKGNDRAEDSGGNNTSSFGGGSSSGGGGCVIATHGLSTGGFTKLEKAKAEIWCAKTYHDKWYGEAFRRGYRAAGQRCIDKGKAHEHYQEFKDFVAYGRGVKKGFGLGLKYYLRTAQFFLTGLFISE